MRYVVLLAALLALAAAAAGCDGGGGGQPAPTPSPAAARPSPTPEEEMLAFIRDGDIWLINADGSGERRLTNLGDVQRLSWVSFRELDVVAGSDPPRHLIMDMDGDTTELPFPAGGSWSRDGRLYVIIADQQLLVMDRSGREVARLNVTPPPGEGPKPQECRSSEGDRLVFGPPVFSPEGTVVVAANCASRMSATGYLEAPVVELSLDGAVHRALGELTTNLDVSSGPRFSPDGARIAQAQFFGINVCAAAFNLVVADRQGANLQWISLSGPQDLNEGDQLGGVMGYDWSPDSNALVVSFNVAVCKDFVPEPILAGLYIFRLDGSAEEKLVDGPTQSPAWSPSGRYIAYTTGRPIGRPEGEGPSTIRILDLTTLQEINLGERPQLAWQPQP